MTTKQKPSEEVKAKILEHVKNLGFPQDDLELLDYEGCAQQKTEL